MALTIKKQFEKWWDRHISDEDIKDASYDAYCAGRRAAVEERDPVVIKKRTYVTTGGVDQYEVTMGKQRLGLYFGDAGKGMAVDFAVKIAKAAKVKVVRAK